MSVEQIKSELRAKIASLARESDKLRPSVNKQQHAPNLSELKNNELYSKLKESRSQLEEVKREQEEKIMQK
eukprot:UN32325